MRHGLNKTVGELRKQLEDVVGTDVGETGVSCKEPSSHGLREHMRFSPGEASHPTSHGILQDAGQPQQRVH